ncbi:hypothetical protein Bca52824_038307 [Brassica carinata]|uniref:Uncharacterized protein n=1 Tax=Brassica carinata TaxID=52824 RepID=A0A8X7RLY8_BRACI|nr:hypothetical protein Bca52824_038307 [Brassica carinata]
MVLALCIPTIAAIEGVPLGGDLRICGGNNAAFGLPETRLAVFPFDGGTETLKAGWKISIKETYIHRSGGGYRGESGGDDGYGDGGYGDGGGGYEGGGNSGGGGSNRDGSGYSSGGDGDGDGYGYDGGCGYEGSNGVERNSGGGGYNKSEGDSVDLRSRALQLFFLPLFLSLKGLSLPLGCGTESIRLVYAVDVVRRIVVIAPEAQVWFYK